MSDAEMKPPAPGTFCWNEVMTRDVEACVGFYTQLLGWTTEKVDMGPAGTYTLFKNGECQVGGCMGMDGPQFENVPPHWLSYIAVDDVDATAAKAGELGAAIHCPPMDIPGIGRFCVVQDPTGAAIAFFKGAKAC